MDRRRRSQGRDAGRCSDHRRERTDRLSGIHRCRHIRIARSGEETRTLIKDKSIELRDQASQSLEEAYAKAEAAAAEARARAEELAELTRQRADELKQRGQVVLEEQKARVGKVIDAAKTPGEAKDEKPAPKKSTKKAEGKA